MSKKTYEQKMKERYLKKQEKEKMWNDLKAQAFTPFERWLKVRKNKYFR